MYLFGHTNTYGFNNTMFDRLIIASKNPGKVTEMQELLHGLAVKLFTYKDINWPNPQETGTTFEENAIIKASFVAQSTGIPAIADDTGLCIDALNGSPGIYTARWANDGKDYVTGIERIQKELANRPSRATYVSCVAFSIPNGHNYIFMGTLNGKIVLPPQGPIIGYESIFIPDGMDRTLSALPHDMRMQIHHRTQSIKKFKVFIDSMNAL